MKNLFDRYESNEPDGFFDSFEAEDQARMEDLEAREEARIEKESRQGTRTHTSAKAVSEKIDISGDGEREYFRDNRPVDARIQASLEAATNDELAPAARRNRARGAARMAGLNNYFCYDASIEEIIAEFE